MTTADVTPRSLRPEDVAALVGLLAKLEGELLREPDGTVPVWASGIAARLQRDGLLDEPVDGRAVRQCLNDLNHRLRYVLGEYSEPPRPLRVP